MADLVNDTAKRQLSPKNSEASALKGGGYDVLGGPTWDNKGDDSSYKIDASKGIGTDTSIPKATGPEGSHLPKAQEDVDVKFDGDDDEVDDLDKELDAFEEVDPINVDLEVDDDDDDDKKDVKEGTLDPDDKIPALQKGDGGDGLTEEDDDNDNPFTKKDKDKDDVTEEDEKDEDDDEKKKFNFQKESRRGRRGRRLAEADSLGDPELSDSKIKSAANDAGLPIKEEDDEDEDKDKKLDEEIPDFIQKKIDAKKGDKDDKDDVKEESVKIRIKLPNTKLFESVNMSAKAQKKVGVVFEQAIRETTKQVATQLHRHYKKLHESRITNRDAAMGKQMDAYLSYVTEEWMKANRPVIRQSLRSQLAEEFLNGLQRLFKEHYIDVPDSKVDVLEKLTAQNAKLKSALNEQHAQKLKLRRLAEAANKARIVAEFARGMSEVSGAKLHKLAEDTQYASAKDFREKLSMLKESYFPKAKATVKGLPEENIQEETPKSKKLGNDPDVNAIADVLSRQSASAKW